MSEKKTLSVGDVYINTLTGEVVLVGDVNQLSGECDDCTNGMLSSTEMCKETFAYYVKDCWSHLGNVGNAVAELVAATVAR